jgi:hypothetical protein
MEDGDDEVICWTLWGKVFERGNKECEIGGTDISYIEIGV